MIRIFAYDIMGYFLRRLEVVDGGKVLLLVLVLGYGYTYAWLCLSLSQKIIYKLNTLTIAEK